MKKIILTSMLLCFYAERITATEIPHSSQWFQGAGMPLAPVESAEMSDRELDGLSFSFSQLGLAETTQETDESRYANGDFSSSQMIPFSHSVPTANSDVLSSSSSQLELESSEPSLSVRARSNSDSALIQPERTDSTPAQALRTNRNAKLFTPVSFVGAGKRTQRKFLPTRNAERNILLGLQKLKRGFQDKKQNARYLHMMAGGQTEGKL